MRAIRKSAFFLIFVSLIAAACHYLFSWIGFNPTDDGFVLSASRRILGGEIPHISFLSLRPPGSSYLHAPEVKYGGDHVFMISRLVFWVQSAIIAWIWVAIADKLVNMKINIGNRFMLALIVFIFNVHSFPAMAWTTLDGLFFATLGLWMITHFNKNANQVGYILLGCAALCKQNFLILIPGVFIMMGHFKRPYYILDALTPVIVYSLLMWRNDAINMMMEQVFSRKEIVETGIIAYVTEPAFYAGLILPIAIKLLRTRYKGLLKNIDFILVFALILLGAASLYLNVFTGDFSFALFGFLNGYLIVHVTRKGVIVFNSLVLLIAWTVSISLGYNTPALASGILIAALLAINYDRELFDMQRQVKYPIAIVVIALLMFCFGHSRTHHAYKETLAKDMTYDLGDVMAGAQGIKTNELVYRSIKEIDSLQAEYAGELAVVPDYSAWWVTAPHINPLNMDWPNMSELDNPSMQIPFTDHLLSKQGNIVIAVQKYRASELAYGLHPLEDEEIQFPVIRIVEEHFRQFDETSFFLLYR